MGSLCVFAGTSEGRRLIERLAGRGARLTVCVATEYGAALLGRREDVDMRVGRLDTAQMEALLRAERFDAVVDATHPYADRATDNIAAACAAAGIEYWRLTRASDRADSDGAFVADAAACAEYLKGTRGNVLLTTGTKDLPALCADAALRGRLYARVLPAVESLRACEACGIVPDHIIAMQGPFDEDTNVAMLRAVNAAYLVTKDTGGAGGYAGKIRAAGRAGVQAVIIGRPDAREGLALEALAEKLEERFHLSPTRKRVVLAGFGMGGDGTRTRALERALDAADCVIGATRLLADIDGAGKRVHEASRPADIARIIREDGESRRFVVLLSGDAGFFSGAKGVREALGDMDVETLPGISSLQYLCARLGRPWEDVYAVSVHGRDADIVAAVRAHPAVFILVGGEDGARSALARLDAAGLGALDAAVGERLGYPDEAVARGSVAELMQRRFDPLSAVLVENPGWAAQIVTPGLPDDAFERDGTPMTKSEVRAVALSKLRLTRGAVLFDIGSGSGSVTVEAARLAEGGRVFAVDMDARAAALTRRNAARFGLGNVEVIEGRAPGALDGLPAPTHAFIGGSGGDLEGIVRRVLEMNPRARIVANAVTLEGVAALSALAKDFEHSDIAQVAVSKPRQAGPYRLMAAQNPVLVCAMWNGEEDA